MKRDVADDWLAGLTRLHAYRIVYRQIAQCCFCDDLLLQKRFPHNIPKEHTLYYEDTTITVILTSMVIHVKNNFKRSVFKNYRLKKKIDTCN